MVHIQVVWIKHWYMTFIFNIEHSTGTGNNYRRKWPKSGIKLYTTSILWSFRAMIVTVPCIGIRYISIHVKHIIIIIWEKFKDTTGVIRSRISPNWVKVRVMVFNATFNNISVISWRLVLFVEETGVPEKNHQPVASHWQTLSHNVVSSTPRLSGFRTHNVSDDGIAEG
jgi:hypothetical protein